MEWPSIDDYALIGDCRSAALVDRNGSIDWLCWPRFDSPAFFAAILDPERGGRFRIGPVERFSSRRRYLPETNVLETTFSTAGGEARLLDLLPVADEQYKRQVLLPDHELLRVISCTRGELAIEVEFDPRSHYGAGPPMLVRSTFEGLRAGNQGGELLLRCDRPIDGIVASGRIRLRMRAGERISFSLTYTEEAPAVLAPLEEIPGAVLRSVAWWQAWSRRIRYEGPWRDAVVRSALALKLLIYAPSGAVVAAPTTSLPEQLGADKNWDYRFCWLRDASFIVRALLGIGIDKEAEAFVSWLLHSTRLTRPRLGVLYQVFGEPGPEEKTVPLRGYRDSRPVRIGNAAAGQLQLDVYGEVIDAAAIYLRNRGTLDRETQRFLRQLGKYVCDHWREPDEGIWEVRSGRYLHTHSLVLCWVALDRLIELCALGVLRGAPVDRYHDEAAHIRRLVEERAWNPALQSYSALIDGDKLDATLLLVGWYGFEKPGSQRMEGTWQQISSRLGAGGSLLYRYLTHGGSDEGAFGICSFWEVDYLARAGRCREAEARFEELQRYANDLGLYGEEIDARTGRALGNFPQGFTHVGLINAALSIEAARGKVAG